MSADYLSQRAAAAGRAVAAAQRAGNRALAEARQRDLESFQLEIAKAVRRNQTKKSKDAET